MKLKRRKQSLVIPHRIENLVREVPTTTQQVTEVVEPKEVLVKVDDLSELDMLYEKAAEIDENCYDCSVKVDTGDYTTNFALSAVDDSIAATFVDTNNHHHMGARFTDYSLSQFATKVGVPTSYIRKCMKNNRTALAIDNLHSWMEEMEGRTLFIRKYYNEISEMQTIRGVLSDRYACCDTMDILSVLEKTVDLSTYKVKEFFLNEERFHLRLVSKDMLPIDDEDLFAGIFIDSSDVGRSVLKVCFGIYKQICTNGLCIARNGGTIFEQKHIGITPEEFNKGLVASMGKIDILTENAVEWIESSRNSEIKLSSQEEMDKFIADIRQRTLLSEVSAKKVIDLMENHYSFNKWGLINSITEVAQDFTLERRLELEKIAGNILVA